MRIEELVPIRFGRLRGEPLGLQPGLNLICGPNESGKSTYAALIRFLLYGFSSQGKSKQNPLPERAKFVPWDKAGARGEHGLQPKRKSSQAAPGGQGVEAGVFGVRRGDGRAGRLSARAGGRTVWTVQKHL